MISLNPEFELPFRLTDDGVAEVEQGSFTEIQQCVYVVCCFHPGELLAQPSLGIPDQLFQKGGSDLDILGSVILENEDRAQVVIERDPAWLSSLVETISIRRDNSA